MKTSELFNKMQREKYLTFEYFSLVKDYITILEYAENCNTTFTLFWAITSEGTLLKEDETCIELTDYFRNKEIKKTFKIVYSNNGFTFEEIDL